MTNEERREVARRLRENAEAHPDMSLVLNVAFADEGLRPEGMKEWKVTSHDAAMRLADLIDPGEDVTVDAYDLISEGDRETLRWVREQDGLRPVQNEVSNYATLCRSIQDADNRRIEMCSILGIDVDTGWSDACEELRNRLIPESYEWPRYEDGDPVKLGDMALIDGELDMVEQVRLTIQHQPVIVGDGGSQQLARGERVKRPAPKVLDADGVEVELGDDLYSVEGMLKFHVSAIDKKGGRIATEAMFALDKWADPKMYTHRAPVLAADGMPLRVGETVWSVDSGTRYTVEKNTDELIPIKCRSEMGTTVSLHPSQLTHERPDSWKRIEEDLGDEMAKQQCGPISPELACKLAGEYVRRCRALAERGE